MINTTLSFRAAYRFGVPHLAGQAITLVRRADGLFIVEHRGRRLALVYAPQVVRELGGIPRKADDHLPARGRSR